MATFTNEPDPSEYYRVVETKDLARYTDVSQAKWFMDRLAFAFGGRYGDVNARFDADGTTIRWFGEWYNLPLGHYLWAGQTPLSPEEVENSSLRPLDRYWPTPEPEPQPEPEPEPVPEGESEAPTQPTEPTEPTE